METSSNANFPIRSDLRAAVREFGQPIAVIADLTPYEWESARVDPGNHPEANVQSSISIRYVTNAGEVIVVTTFTRSLDRPLSDVAFDRILATMLSNDPGWAGRMSDALSLTAKISVTTVEPVLLDGTHITTKAYSAAGVVVLITESNPEISITGGIPPALTLWDGAASPPLLLI